MKVHWIQNEQIKFLLAILEPGFSFLTSNQKIPQHQKPWKFLYMTMNARTVHHRIRIWAKSTYLRRHLLPSNQVVPPAYFGKWHWEALQLALLAQCHKRLLCCRCRKKWARWAGVCGSAPPLFVAPLKRCAGPILTPDRARSILLTIFATLILH